MKQNENSLDISSISSSINKSYLKDASEIIDYKEYIDRVIKLSSDFGESDGTSSIVSFLPASIDMFVLAHTAYKTNRPFIMVGPDVPKNYLKLILETIDPDIIAVPNNWEDIIPSIDSNFVTLNSSCIKRSIQYRKKIKKDDLFFKSTNIKKEDTAYVILTSGSTGNPKPVAVSRSSLYIYSNWYKSVFNISRNDRIVIACSPGFDMMINALFPPIKVGASILIPDRSELLNPTRFIQFLSENRITFINMTPSFSDLLLENINESKTLPDIRILEFGGDQLSKHTARKWRKLAPNAEQYNCYGVAEATVTSFWHRLREEDFKGNGIVPIGKPLGCMDFKILQVKGESTNTGILQLQGPLISMGYIIQSGNDSNFIKNEKGDIIAYKTGDLVHFRNDELIEFFGRSDKQIKISGGYRVDLLEIESLILNKHDDISKVFVLHQNIHKTTVLWAFCVSKNRNLEPQIKETITNYLPTYVRLAGIIILDSLPLNNNGKVDISQLEKHIKSTSEYNYAQKNNLTDILGSLWERSLGYKVKNIIDKDYFEIGGTSFSFANLVGLIENKFEISVDLSFMLSRTYFKDQLEYISNILGKRTTNNYSGLIKSKITARYSQTSSVNDKNEVLSIIGAGIITPKCNDLGEYLNFLKKGESIKQNGKPSRFMLKKDIHLNLVKYCFEEVQTEKWSNGLLLRKEEIEQFDPQYLLWYAVAKQAIDNSNISLANKRVGVFAGLGPTFFDGNPKKSLNQWTLAGTTPSFATGILSHEYNFKGPNMVVDTACSSSLVAIHLACQSLLADEIDVAIAGGAQLFHSKKSFELLEQAGIVSPSGKCIPFSKEANGYIPGEGAGAVVLTTNSNLKNFKGNCLGKIIGTVVNHDGKTATTTLPNLKQQKVLYKDLFLKTGIDPEKIAFVEAHGTGTVLGDPIEVSGIRESFNTKFRSSPLYVGSAKAYFGHLHYASGVIGFIKALLQLNEKKVFKQPNIVEINPRILVSNDNNLKIPLELINLKNCEYGIVNSFGFSGTNCSIAISENDNPRLIEAMDENPTNEKENTMSSLDENNNKINQIGYTVEDIKKVIAEIISSQLYISPDSISFEKNAIELGIDSVLSLDISDRVMDELNIELSPSIFLEHSSLDSVINEVVKILNINKESTNNCDNTTHHKINSDNLDYRNNTQPNYHKNKEKYFKYDTSNESLKEGSITVTLSEQFRSENEVLKKLIDNELHTEIISMIKDLLTDQHKILRYLLSVDKREINYDNENIRNEKESNMVAYNRNQPEQDDVQIEEILSDILNLPVDMISERDDLEKDLGITSLKRIDLCTKILKTNKGNMDMFDELLTCRSIEQIRNILK